ncbi:MAG: cation transporter [Thermoleophilia bacterium]
MQQAILTSPKISCGHCKMTVEGAAGSLAGVDSVNADPETKKVEVTFDESQVTIEEIKKAIEAAGYPVD